MLPAKEQNTYAKSMKFCVSANPFAFTKYLTDSIVRVKNFLHNSALSAVALAPKPLKCAHHM